MAEFSRNAINKNLNPVFQDVTIPNMNTLNINITHFTKEMREIDYQLDCSDDEDCKMFPYLYFAKCEDGDLVEDFSGSGGSDEDSTEPVSSGSTPTPRFNHPIATLPNFNISLPPSIIYTDSTPTTASPTRESDKSTVANTTSDNTTTSETSINNNNFTQITNHHSGVSPILHSELWYSLLPMVLWIFFHI